MSACKWCGSYLVSGEPREKVPALDRWICRGCGAMGYYSDPSPEQLAQMYEAAWTDSRATGRFAAGSTTREIALSLVKATVGSRSLGACLDFGGGSGLLASALAEIGADVYVIEPYGRDPGIEGVTWRQSLDQLPKGIKFDHIFMVAVIEHLLDPVGVVDRLKWYLKPRRGRLIITTPNAKGWRARISGTKWHEAQNPTHINLFSPTSLEILLRRAGYRNMRRIRRPVRYHQAGLKRIALGVTQVLGVDGGIRVTVETDAVLPSTPDEIE